MDLSELALFLIAITALAALGTTFAAYKALTASKKAAELPIINEFMSEYASPDMKDALRLLADFKKIYGRRPTGGYRILQDRQYPIQTDRLTFDKLDAARRMVKFYFLTPYRLYKSDFISYAAYREISNQEGMKLFLQIIVPMERLIAKDNNTKYEITSFKEMKTFYSYWQK